MSHLDIYPTLCELAGIERPEFAEMTWHAAYDPQRTVRTERWKFIRRFSDRATPMLANIDDSPGKSLLLAGDLEGTVGRVLDGIGITRPREGPLARQRLSRQSDELSESWVQSYLEDVSRR